MNAAARDHEASAEEGEAPPLAQRAQCLRIEQLAPTDAAAHADWDRFAFDCPEATIYHLTAWRTVLAEVFGHQSHYLLARDRACGIRGILPLVRQRSWLFGDHMVSLPAVNYGGPCASDEAAYTALINAATGLARELGVAHVELRASREHTLDLPVRTDKVSMRLALPKTPAELWSAIGSKARAQVKRPQKEGARCYFGGAELIPEFYAVFSRNMRDLGTPVYPRRLFERVCAQFPKQASVAVVRLAGEPVAAGFLLGHRGRAEIPWASSLRDHNHVGVNMLLYWAVLEHSIDQGYETFDFGRSSVDSGTYRFKKQWGGQPHPLYWYYWLRDGDALPALTTHNPKYQLAIRAWQRLPLAVANRLGPQIVKGLP